LIFQAFRERGVTFDRIDTRQTVLDVSQPLAEKYDAVLIRCVSNSRALYAARLLQNHGVKTVNSYEVISTCGDKVLTTLALVEHNVPTPRTAVAFSQGAALSAVEQMGYPAVLKPAVGSWGRLMGKLNDREAAEAVIEHEAALDKAQEAPFYVQDYVHKPGYDIRALVVGDRTVYAVYRSSDHWITNTARGGMTSHLSINEEIDFLSRGAAAAVGGGIVAIDILEEHDGTMLVNEVNHTPEFHGAMQATNVDIAGAMVDYVINVAKENL
jgi:[lysine-biosynthesis-protein LysW]--L-2-aminoadipate ligase